MSDINCVLNYMNKYVKTPYMHDSESMLNHIDIETILKYIYDLQQENKQLKENKKELIEFLKEYDKYRDSFKWNEQDYIDTIEKIKEILGDKENE